MGDADEKRRKRRIDGMTKAREILENVKNGKMPIDEAEAYFSQAPYEELGYAKLDMHREIRSGFQEVVFAVERQMNILFLFIQNFSIKTEVFLEQGQVKSNMN